MIYMFKLLPALSQPTTFCHFLPHLLFWYRTSWISFLTRILRVIDTCVSSQNHEPCSSHESRTGGPIQPLTAVPVPPSHFKSGTQLLILFSWQLVLLHLTWQYFTFEAIQKLRYYSKIWLKSESIHSSVFRTCCRCAYSKFWPKSAQTDRKSVV